MSFGAFTRRPAVLLALGLCLVGVLVSVLGRLASGPPRQPRRAPFAGEAGAHAWPAFSPDGKRAAYSSRQASDPEAFHILVRALAGGAPRQLTGGQASDIGPVWSPDGAWLAFLRVEEDVWRIMVVPAAGGEPRQVIEFAAAGDVQPLPSAAWTRDGKSLVVAGAPKGQPSELWMVAVDTGSAARLTNPAPGTPGDFSPAVSPDGATVAFVRGEDSENRESRVVYLRDLSTGGLRRLTFEDRPIRGLAWMPGGRELVYASDRGTGWRLWRLTLSGGNPRDLLIAGSQAQFPAISRDGRLLFTERTESSSIWRAELSAAGAPAARAPAAGARERPLIRSKFREIEPAISPDGRRIANVSDRGFEQRISVGNADGAGERYQLATLFGTFRLRHLRWSPDGAQLMYEFWVQDRPETFRIEVKPYAQPVRVLERAGGASWSHDGKSIYYESQGRIRKAASDGSGAREIAPARRGDSPEESQDGAYVYFRSQRSIWRVPSGGGQAEEAIVPEHGLAQSVVQPVRDGVYYLGWDWAERAALLEFYDFAARKSTARLTMKDADLNGDAFRVSPDGKYVLYSKTDRNETNLVLVDDFQ
jgi:Tol biopolymer transport system component